jgi:hypothetical protein
MQASKEDIYYTNEIENYYCMYKRWLQEKQNHGITSILQAVLGSLGHILVFFYNKGYIRLSMCGKKAGKGLSLYKQGKGR